MGDRLVCADCGTEAVNGACPDETCRRGRRPDARIYTASDVQRIIGIGPRQVHDWCTNGIFGPHHINGPGSGSRRRFTDLDLVVARTCKTVRDALDPGASGGRGGARHTLLRRIADQVRAGASVVRVDLGNDVVLTARVVDVHLRSNGDTDA